MKRFTETCKWDDRWFRKLSPREKCLWLFICDRCDPAGVIDLDLEFASFVVGEEVTEEDVKALDARIQKLPNGKVFIPQFIEFQYGQLSENCPAHRPVFAALAKNKIKGYSKAIDRVSDTLQEKDKEKDKDKKGGTGGGVESPVERLPEPVRSKFLEWIRFRKGLGKKPKDWDVLFSEQVDWLRQFAVDDQLEILSQSIRNGWQGLFEPKRNLSNGYAGPNGHLTPAERKQAEIDKANREYREKKRQREEEERRAAA